ncbi:MAG: hypothetical protein AAGA10_25185 [Bacteroidota bacterium]
MIFQIINFTSIGASISESTAAQPTLEAMIQSYPGTITFVIIIGYILSILVLNLVYALKDLGVLSGNFPEEALAFGEEQPLESPQNSIHRTGINRKPRRESIPSPQFSLNK